MLAAVGAYWYARARRLELHGAAVFITGGSRGLGLILAHKFGRHEARVAICARDSVELQRASADLGTRGKTAVTVPCDVSDWGK